MVLYFKKWVGSEHEMILEGNVIDPSFNKWRLMHGYTLTYILYGSVWELLRTGTCCWTRENV